MNRVVSHPRAAVPLAAVASQAVPGGPIAWDHYDVAAPSGVASVVAATVRTSAQPLGASAGLSTIAMEFHHLGAEAEEALASAFVGRTFAPQDLI